MSYNRSYNRSRSCRSKSCRSRSSRSWSRSRSQSRSWKKLFQRLKSVYRISKPCCRKGSLLRPCPPQPSSKRCRKHLPVHPSHKRCCSKFRKSKSSPSPSHSPPSLLHSLLQKLNCEMIWNDLREYI
jgi:hypothetical protein